MAFKYTIVREIQSHLGVVKNWLCWDGSWAVATNSAAGFPSVGMAQRHLHTTPVDGLLNNVFIEGPRGGYHSIFPRDRNLQLSWERTRK